jgi:hypothetical protein
MPVNSSKAIPRLSVLGFHHPRFGHAVVFVRRQSLFLAAPSPEQTLGRFRALLLQPLTQLGVALAQAVQVGA